MSTHVLRETINTPEFTYFHLEWYKSHSKVPDAREWQQRITHALQQVLGLSGTAILTEILHITSSGHAYVRVPGRDGPRFWAALVATTEIEAPALDSVSVLDSVQKGLRVLGVSDYLMGLLHRSRDLEQQHDVKVDKQ
ncbi:hypothetical protein PMAC_002445 [Pneumocystis sp. 'macacae']|nr:hypothetical protein PMAC_002445 [Pneumocystis sp. 'macacae']